MKMTKIAIWVLCPLKPLIKAFHGLRGQVPLRGDSCNDKRDHLSLKMPVTPRNQVARIPIVLLIFIIFLPIATPPSSTIDIEGDSPSLLYDVNANEAKTIEASASWTADMVYWLDAHDLDGDGTAEGIAAESGQSSGQVSTWVNKAGADNFTDDAGTNPGTSPDLKENQINFNPAIQFNESVTSDYLGAAVTNFPTNEITQFLVVKTSGSDDGFFSYTTADGDNEFTFFSQNVLDIYVNDIQAQRPSNDLNNNLAHLLSVDRNLGTLNIFQDGLANSGNSYSANAGALTSTGTIILGQDQDNVGGGFQTFQAYQGLLSEVITFSKVLSSVERQTVESYLAIKYGITLDQTSGTDYLASNQVIVWDYSENTTYINDIAGIGRDDDSDQDQPKSKSENSDAIMTVEAAGSMTNGRFLVWGNDNASTTQTSVFNQNGVDHDLLSRTWRIQEKSMVDVGAGIGTAEDLGLVNISFDLTGITYEAERVRLRTETSPGVYTVLSAIPTVINDQVTFSGVDLTDGMLLGLIVDFTPKLFFSIQPSNTIVNNIINDGTGIVVSTVDANDAVLTSFTQPIFLSIATDPSGGAASLSGTLTRAAVGGQATFDDISLDVLGEGYALQAKASEKPTSTSSSFNIQNRGPGGVEDGLLYWLDAHDLDGDGTAEGLAGESGQTSGQVSIWVNKTGGIDFDNTAGQANGTTPDLKENQINFNEAIDFNESVTSDYLGAAVNDFPTTGITQFVVFKSLGSGDGIFSFATSGSDNEFLLFSQENLRTYIQGGNRSTGFDLNNGDANILSVDRLSLTNSTNAFVNGLGYNGNSYSLGSGDFASTGTITLAQEQDVVGGGFQNSQAFVGEMAEVITYSKVLSVTERQRVESYLAIKYGITLDQTTGTDYLASNEVVVWDYSQNTTYINDIAGIGRDYAVSNLIQPKSKSENTDAILTIEAAGSMTNGRFLIWGNDNSSLTGTSNFNQNGVGHDLMDRIWRIQEKSMVDAGSGVGTPEDFGLVNISFDLTGITYDPDRIRLRTEESGVFTVLPTLPTINNDQVTFSGVNLTDGMLIGLIVDFTPKIAFSIQPTNSVVNGTINDGLGIAVSALDANDILVTSFSETITLSLATDPSGGSATLAGTLSKVAVAGIATFDDISLDVLGEGYTLQAVATGITAVISDGFDIQNSGPGGVSDGLVYWMDAHDLDADGIPEGTSESGQTAGEVSTWANKTGGVDFTNVIYTLTGTTPDLKTAQMNFNEGIEFNESVTTDFLGALVSDFPTTDITQFLIFKSTSSSDALISVMNHSDNKEFYVTNQEALSLTINEETQVIGNDLNNGNTEMLSVTWTNSSGYTYVYQNGLENPANPYTVSDGATLDAGNVLVLGQNQSARIEFISADAYKGQLAEVITYSSVLNSNELEQVNSYLALKYGVTLDQGTGMDYLNSVGAVVWDNNENATYINDISGIGRDDNSALNQKQSKSINSDAIVTIGLDDDVTPDGLETTNVLNDGSFSTDRSFLIWSNDGAAIDEGEGNVEFDRNLGVRSRLNREWRIQETGAIGTVTVEFDISAIAGPTGVGTNDESQIQLLVDEDGDFSGGNQALVSQFLVTPADGLVRFRVDFTDGNYFTLVSAENIALSVELVSFEAKPQADHVLLEWVTTTEPSGTAFRIERATGDLNFKAIATITGRTISNGLNNYSFRDSEPQHGNNYYRLVDVDEQGIESVSEILSVYYSGKSSAEFLTYPNPVQIGKFLYISTEIQSMEGVAVFLITSQGRQLTPKLSIDMANKRLALETENLKPGIYMLRLITRDGSTVQHSKFLVKD